jgi:hypothetical protein
MGVRIRLIAMVFVLGIGMLAGCATSPPPSGGPVVPTAPSADAGCRGPEYLPRQETSSATPKTSTRSS